MPGKSIGRGGKINEWIVESVNDVGGYFVIFTVGSPAIPTDTATYPDFKFISGVSAEQAIAPVLSRDVPTRKIEHNVSLVGFVAAGDAGIFGIFPGGGG